MSKETYYSVKRDILQCQKRPTKETYSVKRDLRCAPDTNSQTSVPWCVHCINLTTESTYRDREKREKERGRGREREREREREYFVES